MDANDDTPSTSQMILYQTEDGKTRIQCRFQTENVWLTQRLQSDLYQVGVNTINHHIKGIFGDSELRPEATIRQYRIVQNEGMRTLERDVIQVHVAIYAEAELAEAATIKDYLIVRSEGARQVGRPVKHHSLEMILSCRLPYAFPAPHPGVRKVGIQTPGCFGQACTWSDRIARQRLECGAFPGLGGEQPLKAEECPALPSATLYITGAHHNQRPKRGQPEDTCTGRTSVAHPNRDAGV